MLLDITHWGDNKLCYATDCFWNNQTWKDTQETQILPLVLWDLLGVIIPPPHASVLSKPSATTSPINFIPQSHKPHAANYLPLIIFFARIRASRAKETSHAHGSMRCTVTWDYFFFLYLLPPLLHTSLTCTDAEQDGAGGGARWSAPSPVTHWFHFRDLWGHQFHNSHQHVGNVRWGEKWVEQQREGKDPDSDEVMVNPLPLCWKGTCCAAAPAERGSQHRPAAPTSQHDFHQGATHRSSVPRAR